MHHLKNIPLPSAARWHFYILLWRQFCCHFCISISMRAFHLRKPEFDIFPNSPPTSVQGYKWDLLGVNSRLFALGFETLCWKCNNILNPSLLNATIQRDQFPNILKPEVFASYLTTRPSLDFTIVWEQLQYFSFLKCTLSKKATILVLSWRRTASSCCSSPYNCWCLHIRVCVHVYVSESKHKYKYKYKYITCLCSCVRQQV